MIKTYSSEFIYQLFALAITVITVHAIYVAVVRPRAESFLQHQAAQLREDPDQVTRRSPYVLIKDYEQETCFILALWALAVMIYKATDAARERRLLRRELIPLGEGMSILPEDTQDLSRHIQALPERLQRYLVPRALLTALHRFDATRNIQDVSSAVHDVCDAESERLESEMSMIRYIAWAIPSIGFIGTVRGIGDALGQAHKAVEGDITGVTAALGVAFNSTLVALLLSIVLMFALHQLQLLQERLILDAEGYCDEHLIRQLQVR
jgi:biopolymer transport protein ExbB/TolQ